MGMFDHVPVGPVRQDEGPELPTRPTKVALSAVKRAAPPVGPHPDIRRIIDLPHQPVLPDSFPHDTGLVRRSAPKDFEMWDTQRRAIFEFWREGCMFGPISVGWGKTLISLACASIGVMKWRHTRMMLMVPPYMMHQLLKKDIPWIKDRIELPFDVFPLNVSKQKRGDLARNAGHGLYVMPYSILSCGDGEDLLETINPTLIICDECHCISKRDTARTKRFLRFLNASNPTPNGVAMSGTITGKSILEYWHLMKWVLGRRCPLPLHFPLVRKWADAMDAGMQHQPTDSMRYIVQWAAQHHPEVKPDHSVGGMRRSYRARWTTVPGVAAFDNLDIGVDLVFKSHNVKMPDKIRELLRQVREDMQAPNGDEISHAIHTWSWLYQISSGFYYDQVWPKDHPKLAEGLAFHEAEQEYHRQLRAWIKRSGSAKCDTPMLIGNIMARNPALIPQLRDAWNELKARDVEGRAERDRKVVRIDPFKVNACVKWAKGLPRPFGLIWFWHIEFGQWLYERLNEEGVPCHLSGAGDQEILDIRDKVVVASIKANNTGKNLQFHDRQLIAQWPSDAKIAEQMLGRVHRQGQTADTLTVDYLLSGGNRDPDRVMLSACLHKTLYIHQTTKSRMKLLYGTFDPPPVQFDREWLIERGITGL